MWIHARLILKKLIFDNFLFNVLRLPIFEHIFCYFIFQITKVKITFEIILFNQYSSA